MRLLVRIQTYNLFITTNPLSGSRFKVLTTIPVANLTTYSHFTHHRSLSETQSILPTGSVHRTHSYSHLTSHSSLLTRIPSKSSSYSTMSSVTLVESAKKAAAYQAVADHLDPSYHYVGIGSGSTVVYVVEAIAARGPEFFSNMVFIPTGSQSKGLIRAAGLSVCQLPERPFDINGRPVQLDVCFDGADEVDEDMNLIKGGGACLLQEKGVAVRSNKFVVVADYRKISPRLCTVWKAGIPIEVDPFFAIDLIEDLKAMGSRNPVIRSGLPAKAGECVTDNGNWIIDAPFDSLLLVADGQESDKKADRWEVNQLAAALVALEGVIEIGIFHGINGIQAAALGKRRAQKPIAAYFGMADGSVKIQRA